LKTVDPINGWKTVFIPNGDAALRSISTNLQKDLELCGRLSECLNILITGSPDYIPQIAVTDSQVQRKFTVVNVTSSEYTEEDIAQAYLGSESQTGLKRTQRMSMSRRLSKLLVTDNTVVMGQQTGLPTGPRISRIRASNRNSLKEEDEEAGEIDIEDEEELENEASDVISDAKRGASYNFSGQISLPDIIASIEEVESSSTPVAKPVEPTEDWTLVSPVEMSSPELVEFPESEMIESIDKYATSDTPLYRREDSSPEIVERDSKNFYSDTPSPGISHHSGYFDSISNTPDSSTPAHRRKSSMSESTHRRVYSSSSTPLNRRKVSMPETPLNRRKPSMPEVVKRRSFSSSYTPKSRSTALLRDKDLPEEQVRPGDTVDAAEVTEVVLSVDDSATFTPLRRGDSNVIPRERPEVMLDSTHDLTSMTPQDRRSVAQNTSASADENTVPTRVYTKREIQDIIANAPKDYEGLGKLKVEEDYLQQFINIKQIEQKTFVIDSNEDEEVYAIIDFAYPKVVCLCIG
jgi:hypothetical protein